MRLRVPARSGGLPADCAADIEEIQLLIALPGYFVSFVSSCSIGSFELPAYMMPRFRDVSGAGMTGLAELTWRVHPASPSRGLDDAHGVHTYAGYDATLPALAAAAPTDSLDIADYRFRDRADRRHRHTDHTVRIDRFANSRTR